MAAAVPPIIVPPVTDLMDSGPAWLTRSREKLVEDYPIACDRMSSNPAQIKLVISTQNKMYRNHATANQHCYIDTVQLNRVLAFYRWTIFPVKDDGAEYTDASAPVFNLQWINSIIDEYLIPDSKLTEKETGFAVGVPRFEATNWHDVKSKLNALLLIRIGNAGLSLTYLTRESYIVREDTNYMINLQDRRIRSKLH